jgi:mono/diheme cytochrome c family protein
LWGENCLPCHGASGRGDGPTVDAMPNPPPDLTNPAISRAASPIANFDVIKNGRIEQMMPPWGNRLTDEQIWDLTAYVWRLGTSNDALAAGEAIYSQHCAACHGPDGTGSGPDAPAEIINLASLEEMGHRSQSGLQTGFAAADAHADVTVSEAELWQTLDYVRAFSFALPQDNGVLSGQVVNDTSGQPVGNVEVTLRVFAGESEIETRTTQADENGNYSFSKLPTEHSLLYLVEGRYQDVTYTSEPGIFVPDSNETTVDLNVYDTTTSDENISITRLNYLMAFAPEVVQVIQLFFVGNSGNKSYVGQNGQTLTFALPDNAIDVSFQNDNGDRFIETAAGYADTRPISPGPEGAVIVALYNIPYQGDSIAVDVPLPADVDSVNVLIRDQGATLSSDKLQFVDSRQAEGNEFSIFNGSNLSQDEPFVLELAGLDRLEFPDDTPSQNAPAPAGATVAAASHINQNVLLWVMMSLGGLAVVAGGVVYPYLRPRLTHQPTLSDSDPAARRQKLLLLLARLDEEFESGRLDEAVYRRARARYKTELADVMEVTG